MTGRDRARMAAIGRRCCRRLVGCAALLIAAGAAASSASAQGKAVVGAVESAPAPKPKSPSAAGSLFPGGSSKEPISIEADKLEYYNKEQKAIYTGNVVVVQGETTLKCSKLTIFIDRQTQAAKAAPAPQPDPATPGGGQIKHMDVEGPVTMISKDEVATGDRAEFDKAQGKVFLLGHVALTQGTNFTKGDKMTYDMATGVAMVESDKATAGRVTGFFVPGSEKADSKKADSKSPNDKGADAKPTEKARPKAPKKPDVNG